MGSVNGFNGNLPFGNVQNQNVQNPPNGTNPNDIQGEGVGNDSVNNVDGAGIGKDLPELNLEGAEDEGNNLPKALVMPQLDQRPSMPEMNVRDLADVIVQSAENLPEGANGPVPENGSVAETKKFYDLSQTKDLHEVVETSLKGINGGFKKLLNCEAKIKALDEKISNLPNGAAKVELQAKLFQLRKTAEAYDKSVDSLTELVSCKKNGALPWVLSKETEEQRETRLAAEIDNMRVSLRNFRSDFDRKVNVKSGVKAWFSRRMDNFANFFTTTRNRVFSKIFFQFDEQQYIHKNAVDGFSELKNHFEAQYNKIIDLLQLQGVEEPVVKTTDLDDIGHYMATIADMIDAKSQDSFANMCMNSVKTQLRNIAENGGYKLMELELGVGFGMHLTDNAEATVGGKGKYLYKVFSRGDGSITVEHVGGAGADVRAKLRVGDLLQVDGNGEAIIGGGSSHTYKDLDSAVRSMFTSRSKGSTKDSTKFKTLARFNPLFIKGRGIGQNINFAFKYIGAGLVGLAKSPVRLVDALHNLRTGHHLFDCFDPAKQHSDVKYFKNLQDRGIFKKTDKLLTPRRNIVMTEERHFGRGDAGAGVNTKLHLGPAHLRLDNSGEIGGDFAATKTRYRTYMTYLTNEQYGQCLKQLKTMRQNQEILFPMFHPQNELQGNEVGADLKFESTLNELLDAEPGDEPNATAQLAQKILGALSTVVEAEENYGSKFERDAENGIFPDYAQVANNYRKGMLAAAALLEKFDSLQIDKTSDLGKEYAELSERVNTSFEKPAVTFPQNIFQDKFYMQHTTDDGKTVIKHEHVLEYDLLADLKSDLLTKTKLADPVGGKGTGISNVVENTNIGKTVGRLGTMGVVEGASKALGLQGAVGLTVTRELPTGKGKGPWEKGQRMTMDFLFPYAATFDAVMRQILKGYCKEEGIPFPEHLSLNEMISNSAIGSVASTLMRGFFDLKAKYDGTSPDTVIRDSDKNYVNGGQESKDGQWFTGLDFWRSGRTIQLEFHDGRLSALNFGNGEKLSAKVSVPLGPVVVHGGYKFESLENKHSFWTHPSFDALLDMCDRFLSNGNKTQWKHFTQRNQNAFVRMADIFVKKLAKVNVQEITNKNEKDDLERITRMTDKIEADLVALSTKGNDSRLMRIQDNYLNLQQAYEALQAADEAEGEAEMKAQTKMLAMRTIIELTVRHFDIMQDNTELENQFQVA